LQRLRCPAAPKGARLPAPTDPKGCTRGKATTDTRHHLFRYPSAEYFVEYFRNYCGPTVRAFVALESEGREALARDLQELLESRNTSGDETLVVPSDHPEVVAVKA
jgi:hypothetical protein